MLVLDIPTISSPYRKLPGSDFPMAPLFYFRNTDYRLIIDILPQELLHLNERPLDYICGVSYGDGMCKESIYCRLHLFGERALIERSKSLRELIMDEMELTEWFRHFHKLSGVFHSCKSYFAGEIVASPRTCSHYSCCLSNEPHTDEDMGNLQQQCPHLDKASQIDNPKIIECRETTHNENQDSGESSIENDGNRNDEDSRSYLVDYTPGQNTQCEAIKSSGKKFKLIKALFMSKLSRSANAEIEDIVSYLHYRLNCYQDVELEVRAREMQVQYDPYWSSV